MIVWGSIWAPSWGNVGIILATLLGQVDAEAIFEPSYHRKSDCSRNITFSYTFWPTWTRRWGQGRPKIAPRWVQDRLGSLFFRLQFSLRFWIFLGSILVPFWPPKWRPWGDTKLGVPPAGGLPGGRRVVLLAVFLRLAIQAWVFEYLSMPLGVVVD